MCDNQSGDIRGYQPGVHILEGVHYKHLWGKLQGINLLMSTTDYYKVISTNSTTHDSFGVFHFVH